MTSKKTFLKTTKIKKALKEIKLVGENHPPGKRKNQPNKAAVTSKSLNGT
jgi:hypothetical protein